MYRCDVFQKQQSGCSVGSGLKEYRGLSDKICCTVLEKHNITPKSIWLGVGFQILRNAMLPFFILLDPIISNLMVWLRHLYVHHWKPALEMGDS